MHSKIRAFTIKRTDHTGLTVSSLREALPFWVDGLGFEVRDITEFEAGEFLDNVTGVEGAALVSAKLVAPSHVIELLEYRQPASRRAYRPRACDVGSVHIAFETDDIDAVLARIKRFGWYALGIPQTIEKGARAGTRLVYARGPDNLTIELINTK